MAQLPMVEPNDEPAELKAVFDQLRQTRGRVPGMYRTLAHQPAVLAAHRAYFHAALDSGVLPRAFKEPVAFKVARLRGTAYCTGSHRSYALKHGVSAEQLEAIDRGDYSGLDARDQAAMALAEAMVASKKGLPAAVFDGLKRQFAADEIVELVSLVGIMELACSLAEVFELDAD
jgi:AhpD family alkylhydroperoxidase